MPNYSLYLDGPDGPDGEIYIPSYEFPNPMRVGDRFIHGSEWQVVAVTVKQFDAPGEPGETLGCLPG